MDMPKLTVLHLDDWAAVYADNRLIYQGHSIRWEDVLRDLEVDLESMWVIDWWEEGGEECGKGYFPERLDECEGLYADR